MFIARYADAFLVVGLKCESICFDLIKTYKEILNSNNGTSINLVVC